MAEKKAKAAAPKKASSEWTPRLKSASKARPEVAAAVVRGTAPNSPLEGPALAPYKAPYRSANEFNAPLSGPALAPYKPPRRS